MARGFAVALTQVKWRVVSGTGTYQPIPNVDTAASDGSSKDRIEATAISDNAKVFIGGTVEEGSFSFTVNLDPLNTEHQSIITSAKTAGSTCDMQIAMPQVSGTAVFTNVGGFLEGGGPSYQKGGLITASFKYTPNGVFTLTP